MCKQNIEKAIWMAITYIVIIGFYVCSEIITSKEIEEYNHRFEELLKNNIEDSKSTTDNSLEIFVI